MPHIITQLSLFSTLFMMKVVVVKTMLVKSAWRKKSTSRRHSYTLACVRSLQRTTQTESIKLPIINYKTRWIEFFVKRFKEPGNYKYLREKYKRSKFPILSFTYMYNFITWLKHFDLVLKILISSG